MTDTSARFGAFYAEILRAEGLNEFTVADTRALTPSTLRGYEVVVLASARLTAGTASTVTGWVKAGGNLIAMRPEATLERLLGLAPTPGSLGEGYIKVDTGPGPGAGITGATMQFHGSADLWTLAGAKAIATLFSDAITPTSSPALTLRDVGRHGGQAAAFTYDLARSVVETRQGNPAAAGLEQDGETEAIRSDDLFFPSWLDFAKVRIPQADEQQRLLANLITQMNLDRMPLPRFWYLPRGGKAAVVMTGDDHALSGAGTIGQFDRFIAESPSGCSVADWECVRGTSYLYPSTRIMSDATAAGYQKAGFELALHLSTQCADYDAQSLAASWAAQLHDFKGAWPSLGPPRTGRTHCVVWSDWAGTPRSELHNGVRLDTSYYYWPAAWVKNRPGMFTGSGMPMRFADADGSLIDVYQAATQMTDESGIDVPVHIRTLLDGALGAHGYYGVFTANMHTDHTDHPGANAIVAGAQARGVPVVSATQMLDWLDGRNGSSFRGVNFLGNQLRFTVATAAGSRGLVAMLPARAATGALADLTRDGTPVRVSPRRIKGIAYVMFAAAAGTYVAKY